METTGPGSVHPSECAVAQMLSQATKPTEPRAVNLQGVKSWPCKGLGLCGFECRVSILGITVLVVGLVSFGLGFGVSSGCLQPAVLGQGFQR